MKESPLSHDGSLAAREDEAAGEDANGRQLQVLEPDALLRLLQLLLDVHPGEATQAARDEHQHEAPQNLLRTAVLRRAARPRDGSVSVHRWRQVHLAQLHEAHAKGEHAERRPLRSRQAPLEQCDREDGGGEHLDLGQQAHQGRTQKLHGHQEHRVLQRVQNAGQHQLGHFPRLRRPRAENLSRGVPDTSAVEEEQQGGQDHLHDLHDQHHRSTGKGVLGRRGLRATPP
mmetsp:Transcript_7967/g.29817  ORF Transcript_7967/g.29817 Transcript_7967/m.29817 type:complete len:229 (+) Transcript_7967:323-1009(+)